MLALSLLAVNWPVGQAQMQPPAQAQSDAGLPDFSGFNLIDSFARLPVERTKLTTLSDVRRASIDEVAGKIGGALQLADESSDPAAAVRLHDAMGSVLESCAAACAAHRSCSVARSGWGISSPSVARTCCSRPSRTILSVTADPGAVLAT
jgi:hypothetical protein